MTRHPRDGAAGRRDPFPRQLARTRRFSLGQPRAFAIADDGASVLFLRSRGGADAVHGLWRLDLASGQETLVVDPAHVDADDGDLPPEERARRERVREGGAGIVAYSADDRARTAAFALGGRLFVADTATGAVRQLAVPAPVVDPRVDPSGRHVAFVHHRALWIVPVDGGEPRRLAAEDDPDVSWGLADFIAAEEMHRTRGFWWAPDGDALVAARVDARGVQQWHIADPARPDVAPTTVRYPAAGTANADVSLAVVALDGTRTALGWDADAFPYLVDVVWSRSGPLTAVVQSRDQRAVRILAFAPDAGAVRLLAEQRDERWVELVAGVPRYLPDGRLVTTVDEDDTRKIAVEGRPVTPVGLQVRQVVGVGAGGVVFAASEDDPTAVALWRADDDGTLERLTPPDAVAAGVARHGVLVVHAASLEDPAVRVVVRSGSVERQVRSLVEPPALVPRVELLRLGERRLAAALLLPSWYAEGTRLPVLVDPYGGPHAQRVLRRADAFLAPQWFAEQGFAVLVADGRGTPGRGPAWERAVAGDLATAPLEDQVDALHAAAAAHPDLDLDRVAIRGWSFGGYLAALAVLRRPDVFHAAIAGAPVTDWSLYDTHYTERYLGHPAAAPEAYRQSSLLDDAAGLERPLLLVHGLADDNVVAAHTLRLSAALLAAGRPHTVLPLSGVTHMTPQEVVAENLLRLQLAFLRETLDVPLPPPDGSSTATAGGAAVEPAVHDGVEP